MSVEISDCKYPGRPGGGAVLCRTCTLRSLGYQAPFECELFDFDVTKYFRCHRPWFLPEQGCRRCDCEMCGERLPIRALIQHVKEAHFSEYERFAPHKCYKCNELFYDEIRAKRHEVNCARAFAAKKRLDVTRTCVFCPSDETLYTGIDLSKHLRRKHPHVIKYSKLGKVDDANVPKPFACTCSYSCDSVTELVKHWEGAQKCVGDMEVTPLAGYEPLLQYLDAQPSRVCDEVYETDEDEEGVLNAFQTKEENAKNEKIEIRIFSQRPIPRVCPICKNEVYSRSLQSHIEEFHERKQKKQTVCERCRVTVTLNRRRHTKERCDERHRTLVIRARIHAPANCALCGMGASSILQLAHHFKNEHTDMYRMCMSDYLKKETTKLLTCTKCAFSTVSAGLMIKHFHTTPSCEDGAILVATAADIAHLHEKLPEFRKTMKQNKAPDVEIRRTTRITGPNLEREEWVEKLSSALAPPWVKQREANHAAKIRKALKKSLKPKRRRSPKQVNAAPSFASPLTSSVPFPKSFSTSTPASSQMNCMPSTSTTPEIRQEASRSESSPEPNSIDETVYMKCVFCDMQCPADEIMSHRERQHTMLHAAHALYPCECGTAFFYDYSEYMEHVTTECSKLLTASTPSSFRHPASAQRPSTAVPSTLDHDYYQQPSTSTAWLDEEMRESSVEEWEEEEEEEDDLADEEEEEFDTWNDLMKDELAEDMIEAAISA